MLFLDRQRRRLAQTLVLGLANQLAGFGKIAQLLGTDSEIKFYRFGFEIFIKYRITH